MLSMLEAIQKRLGIADGDPEVSLLEESTQPEQLVRQIDKVIDQEAADLKKRPEDDKHGAGA